MLKLFCSSPPHHQSKTNIIFQLQLSVLCHEDLLIARGRLVLNPLNPRTNRVVVLVLRPDENLNGIVLNKVSVYHVGILSKVACKYKCLSSHQ